MKKWYSKWWIWSICFITSIILFFVIKASSNFDDVNSGDLLNYYGSILSFIGTIVLGIIASHQSWKANSLSERLLKIEEDRYLPIVDIQEIIEPPSELKKNTYSNAMQITLNDSLFYFNENNEVDFCVNPIFAFKMKNICSNHIISVGIKHVQQNTIFNNKKVFESHITGLIFNGGVCVLSNEESQFLMVSGIQHGFPKGLTSDELFSQGYTGRRTELIINFELTNIKGQKFDEIIKFAFVSAFCNDDKLYYPCITDKEILSIISQNNKNARGN